MIKKIPKLRGYRFKSISRRHAIVHLADVDRVFTAGEKVTPASLVAKGLLRRRGISGITVKILGDGALKKKIIVEGCAVSSSAAEKIAKAGGVVTPLS